MGLTLNSQGGGATRARRLSQSRVVLQLALPLGLLALWWLALQRQWVRPYQLPAPMTVLATFQEMLQRGELQSHMIATIGRTLASYLFGVIPAVVLGVASGLSAVVRAGIDPTIQGIRAVPSLAWVPLFLLWFGIGEQARLLLIALGAFLPVYLNTVAGVESVDRRLVEVGRAYGLSPSAITFRIVLPGSLPGILTGLRSGLSMAWMFVVAAELIAASNGLGFLLIDGQSTMRPDRVLAAIITFAFLGRASDAGLAAIERYALRWRDTLGTSDSSQRAQSLSSTLKADRVPVP
jgi:sulfonate transport system permease protein